MRSISRFLLCLCGWLVIATEGHAPIRTPPSFAIPRGGSKLTAAWRQFSDSAHETTKNLLPANWKPFYEQQAALAQERREYYQVNSHLIFTFVTSLWHPLRVFKLFTLSFALVECLEFATGQETLGKFWKTVVKPVLFAKWANLQNWWEKGRQKGGLFHGSTWEGASKHAFHQAWNQQMSVKYQRVLGTTLGLTMSPLLWTAAGWVTQHGFTVLAVLQLNYFSGEQLELFLRPINKGLSEFWGDVDVNLERFRRWLGRKLAKPLAILKTVPTQASEEDPLPAALEQGLIVGLFLGFLTGV